LELLKVVPLGKHHDRAAFSCGNPVIDRYLQQSARQATSRYEAATYVATAPQDPNRILGFFTLVGKEPAVTIMEKRVFLSTQNVLTIRCGSSQRTPKQAS
jgi:hypothetical protein